jgi:fructose-1,6-bisphosphatase/inositol monophosphatase family enzyme
MRLCDTDFSKSLNKSFGAPREGVHKQRFLGMAAYDIIASLLGAILISWTFNVRFLYAAAGVFLAGIVSHWVFCVDTTVNRLVEKVIS